MAQEPTPIEVAPGVVHMPSKAKNSISWREVNLVRWNNGVMEPIGGWEKFNYTAPITTVRAIHQWTDLSKKRWIAYLCDGYVYVEYDGDLYDISPTPAMVQYGASLDAGGYGDSLFTAGSYGTARPPTPERKEAGPAFTLDNWGENLEIMSSADGRLLEWAPSLPPTPCTVVANAPTNNHSFVVTPERFIMLFGAGGQFNEFAWCDQEDNTDWNFADITSQAGKLPVEPAQPVVACRNLGDIGNLFFTSQYAYVSRYIGLPYVFSQGEEIGEGVSPISAATLVRALPGAIWVTESGFYRFNGQSIEKVFCPIWWWIDNQIDWGVARKIAAGVNVADKSEYWFFFPTEPGNYANTKCAIYNYAEGWWSMGNIGRTAGFSADLTNYTVMADGTDIYRHEKGNTYTDAESGPWAESFTANFEGGGKFMTVHQIFPEVQGDYSPLRFSLAYRNRRTPDDEQYSPQRSIQANGAVDMSITARDFRLRIDYTGSSVLPWSVGPFQVTTTVRGIKS